MNNFLSKFLEILILSYESKIDFLNMVFSPAGKKLKRKFLNLKLKFHLLQKKEAISKFSLCFVHERSFGFRLLLEEDPKKLKALNINYMHLIIFNNKFGIKVSYSTPLPCLQAAAITNTYKRIHS